MSVRMDEYLERWAEKYKPISHVAGGGSKEKRFYRISSITSLQSFAANLVNAKSPSMAYVTQVDATLGGQGDKFLLLTHKVFIFVKQEGQTIQNSAMEEAAATEAKLLGSEIAQDLLAYIYNDKRNGNTDLAGIDFKGSVIFTTPMQFNGWWPTEVTFNEIVSRHLCVNPEKYND